MLLDQLGELVYHGGRCLPLSFHSQPPVELHRR